MAQRRSKTQRASHYRVGARLVVEKHRGGAVVPRIRVSHGASLRFFLSVNKFGVVAVRIDREQIQAENIPAPSKRPPAVTPK